MAKGAFSKTWPAKRRDNRSDAIKYRMAPTCKECPSDALVTYPKAGHVIHKCAAHLGEAAQEETAKSATYKLLESLGLL